MALVIAPTIILCFAVAFFGLILIGASKLDSYIARVMYDRKRKKQGLPTTKDYERQIKEYDRQIADILHEVHSKR